MYNELYDRVEAVRRCSLNQRIDASVLTPGGPINIIELNPGDTVYEYKTGKPIKIRGITRCDPQPIYGITYTDGRSMKVPVSEMIYTGKDIHQLYLLKDILDSFIFDEVKPCVIGHSQSIADRLKRDPYIVGALITYGDWDVPYINLPSYRPEICEYFTNSYMVDVSKLSGSKVLFKWRGIESEELVTWDRFLPYPCYTVSHRLDHEMFPLEYINASIRDRMQFIRGIFDVGWDEQTFPDRIGIAHWEEFRLKEVQKILWSMGILSHISYDPNLDRANIWQRSEKMRWRLDILGRDHKIYPGLFYNADNIRYQINNDLKLADFAPRDDYLLKIESIDSYTSSGYMFNIVTENPCTVYVTDNYLPRVSSI